MEKHLIKPFEYVDPLLGKCMEIQIYIEGKDAADDSQEEFHHSYLNKTTVNKGGTSLLTIQQST